MSLPARRTSRTTLAITATLPLLLATAGWSQGLPPIQREFSNASPALPLEFRPEIRGFHDPYDYVRPGLATFEWKDDYWKGSQVPNRASARCPG